MLLFIDSFDHYDFAALTSKWSFGGSTGKNDDSAVGAGFGRRSTNGFKYRSYGDTFASNGHTLEKALVTQGNTFICGFAFKCVTPLANSQNQSNSDSVSTVLAAVQNVGVTHVWIRLNTDGTVSALCGTTVLQTSLVGLTQNVVTYVEVKVVIGAAGTGSVMVRFNGSPVLDISSVTTQVGASSNWTSFYLRQRGGAGGNAEWHLDDFYLADGFGDAPWNNLLGDCRCDCGVPTAEGALSDWAPLTGTNNADMVKEVVADGDTSYVSSVTAGHMDTYVVPNVAVPGSPPTGVQVSMFVRKEAAGLCDLAVVANLGGSPLAIHSKPVINPGTTYAFRTGIFQTNPATGLAWTEAEFNAAEFGFVRAS